MAVDVFIPPETGPRFTDFLYLHAKLISARFAD